MTLLTTETASAGAGGVEQGELFDLVGWEMGAVESWAEASGYREVVGVDEAGRGPLAGPVVAAACVLDVPRARAEGWLEVVADSKLLSASERDLLFDRIRASARACALAQAEADEIDAVNILQASLRAMARALAPVLRGTRGGRVLVAVDGNRRVPGIRQQIPFVKGDSRSYHIAAASILAKVCRDRILARCDEVWPEYGLARHKGYPTRYHRRRLVELGPSPIHRRSFRVTSPDEDGD